MEAILSQLDRKAESSKCKCFSMNVAVVRVIT